MTFNTNTFIQTLCSIGERQLENVDKAAEEIKNVLANNAIPFGILEYKTKVPRFISSALKADGEDIACSGTGLVSGKITSNYQVLSSLIFSSGISHEPNINFNPRCPVSISKSNFYFAPSIAVNRKDILKIITAEKIEGETEVKPVDLTVETILVGNTENPQTIIFCHYDSIGPGATDNASGVAVLLAQILNEPEVLNNNLFVFDANEEISYDNPIYWGYGYREFEKRYKNLLVNAKNIIVVDCIGNAPPILETSSDLIKLAFPLADPSIVEDKVAILTGDFDTLMKVYQAPTDLPEVLDEKYLEDSLSLLSKTLGIL